MNKEHLLSAASAILVMALLFVGAGGGSTAFGLGVAICVAYDIGARNGAKEDPEVLGKRSAAYFIAAYAIAGIYLNWL